METDRLILREMTLDDVEFYFRHFNKDEVVEGCCFPGPKNLEAAKKELELYCIKPFKENRGIRWGTVRKGGNELIGTCGYYDWNKLHIELKSDTTWILHTGDKALLQKRYVLC